MTFYSVRFFGAIDVIDTVDTIDTIDAVDTIDATDTIDNIDAFDAIDACSLQPSNAGALRVSGPRAYSRAPGRS